jgi:hypothetical protein
VRLDRAPAPPEDLYLHLGASQLTAKTHNSARSSVLTSSRRPLPMSVLLHLPAQARGGDAEIGGHVGDGLITGPGQHDRPLAELAWIAHRMGTSF